MAKRILANAQFRRVATNYLRMAISFVLGIFLLRLLLQFGEGVFAAVALTASSIGVAAMLKETVRGATIPELGINYHSGDKERFETAYASSVVISAIAGLFGVFVLGLFWLFLDSFSIEAALRDATGFFIISRMVSTFVSILVSPIMNMMPVTGRMSTYNFWLTFERIGEVGAAFVVFLVWGDGSGDEILFWFGVLSMVVMTTISLLAAFHSVYGNREFWPKLSSVSGKRVREVFHSVGWNGAAVASVNLYLRFDVFAVNIMYGVSGTVIFGLASQLAAYTRQITMGLIAGLDAVVSKAASGKDEASRLKVIEINTRTFELQTISLFGAGIVLVLHADWIIRFLFGDRLSSPETQVPVISLSFLLLMVGMIARGLSEGWMSILAGSGRIKDYGLPVLIGALLNPVLVVAWYYILEPDAGLISVSIIFMVLNIVFHMMVVPAVTARFLKITTLQMLKPMLAPLIVAVLCAIAASSLHQILQTETQKVLATIFIGGVVFTPWFFNSFRGLMRSGM